VPRARISTSGLLWFAYALFIVYGSLTPFRFTAGRDDVGRKLARVSVNPLVAPDTGRRVSIPDVVQNLLFFMPFGLLGGVALGTRRRGAGAAATVIAMAAFLSTAVEAAQLFTVDRVTSVSDVLFDSVGTGAGVWLAALTWPRRWWSAIRPTDAGVRRSLFGVAAAALLVGLARFSPYDPTLDVSTVAAKVHALHRDFWQTRTFLRQNREEDLIPFMLLGGALVTWLRATRVPVAWMVAVVASILAAVVLGAAELIVTTRMPGGIGVAAQAAGAVVGVLATAIWPRPAQAREGWWLPVIGLAIAVALFVSAALSPSVEPGRALHASADSPIMSVIRAWTLGALTFAPVGFGLVVRQVRRAAALAVAVSIALAAVTAAIEWHAAGRMDLALVTAAPVGAWLGAMMARHGSIRFDAALDAVETA
jgi:VanZ family protein